MAKHGSSSQSSSRPSSSVSANDNKVGGNRPAANDNRSTKKSTSSGSVATTKVGTYSSPVPSVGYNVRGNAGEAFFASRANANFERGAAPLSGSPQPGVTPAAAIPRVASSKLRDSKLRIAVPSSVAVVKLGSPVRSPVVCASNLPRVGSSPSLRPGRAPQAAATPNAPSYKGYDALSGERSKAAESRDVRCKPRPEDNTPKKRGGGGVKGKRKFVPWCK